MSWKNLATALVKSWSDDEDKVTEQDLVDAVADAMENAYKQGMIDGGAISAEQGIPYPGYKTCAGCDLDFVEYRDWLHHDCPGREGK